MITKQLMTAEDLLTMPDVPGKQFELVNGELVEMAGSGTLHGLIAELVLRIVGAFVRQHDLGLPYGDNVGYILRRDPDIVCIPDMSYVSWEHEPEEGVPEGYWSTAPDLAVEIVSPGDVAQELYDKVHDYLLYGTGAVWVLWPKHRSISVYTAGGIGRELGPDDELDGGDVLPGFHVRVADIFAVRRKR